jgi:hypothetical protein
MLHTRLLGVGHHRQQQGTRIHVPQHKPAPGIGQGIAGPDPT